MPTVEDYIKKQQSPQKEILQELRTIIFDTFPNTTEEMKWGVPNFHNGLFYIVALKDHVNLGFSIKGLSKKEIAAKGVITHVDQELCRACGECEKACLFDAISIKQLDDDNKTAIVIEGLCTGCGVCNVACPTGAASLSHFEDEQINSVIKSLHDE